MGVTLFNMQMQTMKAMILRIRITYLVKEMQMTNSAVHNRVLNRVLTS
jgi:hypothetical protein